MLSGIQTLRYLDQGLASVREEINRLDEELNHIAQKLHENRRQQAGIIKQIAKIRLDELTQGSLIGDLDAADHRALELLEQRNQAFQQLEGEIDRESKELEKLEKERGRAQEEANQRAQAVIDCEHKVQSELEDDTDYQSQLKEARRLDSIADQAEQKARQAEKDRQEKGKPYEENALFMYLWKRKYGTPEYHANPLTRWLDGWVDRLCNYGKYRVNYWTLLEIPKRLTEHASLARGDAEQALEVLANYETKKAEQAGLPALQENHKRSLEKVDAIDVEIEQKEDMLNELLRKRTGFVEGRDTYMEESLKTLSNALAHRSIYDLNDAAHQTPTPKDNQWIRELAGLQEEVEDLEAELRDHRRMHEAKLDRLQQLEQVRRQFKNHRYDDMRSGFGNEGLITSMFSQFLNGLISSGELWRVLQRHQRHRDVGAWPDFGSGGLGIPTRRKSPWHFPRGRGGLGGGIFKLPRSGGFSSRGGGGGGFRTGGGF